MLDKIHRLATREVSWALTAANAAGGVLVLGIISLLNGGWIESHPGTAAWVQAFGVIAALGVAIIVPNQIAAAERRLSRQALEDKSFGLAESLIGAIWLLEADVNRVSQKLDAHRTNPPSSDAWFGWLGDLVLQIPTPLIQAMPFMHGLREDIIGPFRRAAMIAQTFNGYVDRFSKLERESTRDGWPQLSPLVEGQLKLLRHAIDQVQQMMQIENASAAKQSKSGE